jgi:MarR family 2-MHQ and catechol resistance regulon transcriptional repressor
MIFSTESMKTSDNASKTPGTLDRTEIGEATVLQILRVADLLTRIGDSKVFGKNLTQAQFNVLMVLKRHGNGGISQKDILENLVSTKGNVSIHITNLTRMGCIRKKTSKSDSRMNVITLTAKGRRILAELEPRYIQHLKQITEGLPREQAETAMDVLEYLYGKCNATLNGSSVPQEGGIES